MRKERESIPENALHCSVFAGFQYTDHRLKRLLHFQVRVHLQDLDRTNDILKGKEK
jgi:hypothetical protein